MKKNFIYLFIISLVIISGCGNGVNQENFINSPLSDEQNTGYINLKVHWPQILDNTDDAYIVSTDVRNKTLTASMPLDTDLLVFELFDKDGLTPILSEPIIIEKNPGYATTESLIGPLPVVLTKIKVYGYVFSDHNNPVSIVEGNHQILAGYNELYIELGNYKMEIESVNASYGKPKPVTVYLNVVPPPLPSPLPVSPENYISVNTLPLSGRNIYFNILGKRADSNSPLEPSLSTIDPNFAVTDDEGKVFTQFTLWDDLPDGSGEEVVVEIRMPWYPEERHGIGYYRYLIYKEGHSVQ